MTAADQPPKVLGFFHSGVTVRDMDASLRFYRDGLGLEVEFVNVMDSDYLRVVLDLTFEHITIAYLRIPGGGFVELLEYAGIERQPAASRPCDFGGGHVCLYVDDVTAMTARLRCMGYGSRSAAPVDITAGPNAGARSVYAVDPDGYFVELFQRPS